jgi:subtilisin family serine protease
MSEGDNMLSDRRRWRRPFRYSLAGLASLALVASLTAVASPASAQVGLPVEPDGVVEQQVWDELADGGTTDFWVYLRDAADLSPASGIADRDLRGTFVYQELTQTAADSQAGLVSMLEDARVDFQSYWIANTVHVTGDADLVKRIAALPEVELITATRTYEIPEPLEGTEENRINNVEWGIDRINAPDVWDQFGVRGEGIVVGVIDTGVQHDHPALVEQYRGNLGGGAFDHNFNWHDPSTICGSPSLVPCDNNGHGTHVTGTIVGDDGGENQIGVAPQAQFIAAKGCEFTSCSDTALLSSGQFILAPTDLNNENADPTLRPHIVNNSWGGGANTDPWYIATVQAWVAAGIFPQFANGNNIPGCTAASNPGNLPDSYSAGAFDINNNMAGFSNRGPSAFGAETIKPNLSAPGVNVRSALPGNTYGAISGTSMASPHVAGAVALMWSAAAAIERDIDATRALLDVTAEDTEDLSCGGTPENNNVWGQGKLDAFAAVDQSPRGDTGTLAGTVTDADTGTPISGAQVSVTGEVDRNAVTAGDGTYSFVLPVGDYTVNVSAFGYEDASAEVSIVVDETTVADFALEAVDSVTVTGHVTDGSGHGWALYAQVSAAGTGVSTFTDPLTGAYSLSLPTNDTYTLQVSAEYPGYAGASQQVEVGDSDVTVDFSLAVNNCEAAPGYFFDGSVAVLGDLNGMLGAFLDDNGIPSTEITWTDDPTVFDVIIVSRPGNPGQGVFLDFLDATDAAGTGVVFLDQWSTLGNGIWLLWQHVGNPATRSTNFSSAIPHLFYEVVEEHPILDGFAVGEQILFEDSTTFKDHAWFSGYEGEGRQVIGLAGRGDTGVVGDGIGVQERDNNRHALLSMHAPTAFVAPSNWSDDAGQIFLNAVSWVAAGAAFDCAMIEGGLVLGHVTDANTGDGVNGATVTSVGNPAESTTSFATPNDPNLGDGFYWLFSSLTGAQDFTATAPAFSPETVTVDVVASQTNEANFALGAGLLVVEPTEVSAELRMGQSANRTFTVTNEGTAAANVEFVESGGSFELLDVGEVRVGARPLTPNGSTPVTAPGSGSVASVGELGLAGNPDGRAGVSVTPIMPAVSPMQTTITHSLSQDIVELNSVACSPDGGFSTTENSYLRAFVLDDFGIVGDFAVAEVSFGIETIDPAQTLTVNLYTLDGAFVYSNLTLIGTTDVTVDAQSLSLVSVPVTGTAPAGSTLVVEVDAPDMSGTGRLFIGSNDAGQTAPSYLASASCGLSEPTDTADLGFPGMNIVMNVTGDVAGDVEWLEVSPTNATLQPGESVTVTVSMDSGAEGVDQPGTYTAAVALVHDTPHDVAPVGVTMVVTPPNNWGKVAGTVTGNTCDGASAAIDGALVQVNGARDQVTLFTDASGGYGYWLASNNNQIELIVAAGGFIPQTDSVRVRPGQETVANFHLTPLC